MRIGLVSAAALLLVATSNAFAVDTNNADDEIDAATVPQVDKKIKRLRARVKQLESQVATLETNQLPVEVAVNCGAGETINNALLDHADGLGSLLIRVSGACTESLVISRSDVTIDGQGTASIVTPITTAPSTILVSDGAKKVHINNISLTGGTTAALTANKGAHVVARNIIVQNGGGSGVMALDNAVIDVTGSTIRNNLQGVYTSRGGVISVSASTVENNTTGAIAFKAGIIIFTSSSPDINVVTTGPVLRGNVNGAIARSGGYLEFSDTLIEQNSANGVVIDTGSAAHFFQSFTGSGNVIRNNQANGIYVNKTGNLVLQTLTNVITANARGILCHSASSGYLVPAGFTVTGNLQGDILNCVL